MAKENGGIIGVVNTPTQSVASGVWASQDQYNARVGNIWPTGVAATGCSEVKTVGGFRYHLFDTSSSFDVTNGGDVEIIVIGAGGGGGSNGGSDGSGGGG